MVRNDDKAGHALAWAVLVINQFFSPSKHLLLISDNDYQEQKYSAQRFTISLTNG